MTDKTPDVSRALAALRLDPRTTNLVPRIVGQMYGPEALMDWRAATEGFTCLGFLPTDADVAGLFNAVGRRQVNSIARRGSQWIDGVPRVPRSQSHKSDCPVHNTQEDIAGLFSTIVRVGTAVMTGGASEAARRGIPDVDKFLDDIESRMEKGLSAVGEILEEAAEEGWDIFKKAVTKVIENLNIKNIDSFQDVFDLVITVATGGLHQVVNEGINYLQDKLWELITPYLGRLGEAMGEGYAKGKQATKDAIYTWMDNWDAPNVVANIIWQIVDAIWDIIFGYPPCVCEKACIENIAKALKEAGNPYVKAVGQVLSVVWPICQGAGAYNLNYPEVSPCLYMYGGAEGAPGIKLLPAAKLNTSSLKTVIRIVKILDEDAGEAITKFGTPTAYELYKPYLVDMVARGKDGPEWLGGEVYGRNARYYFLHPQEAQEVLDKASFLDNVLGYVAEYIKWANLVIKYVGKGIDTYQAIESGQYDLEVSMEDLEELGKKALEKGKAKVESEIEKKKQEVEGYIEKAKKAPGQIQQTVEDYRTKLEDIPGQASRTIEDYRDKAQNLPGQAEERARREAEKAKEKIQNAPGAAQDKVRQEAEKAQGRIRLSAFMGLDGIGAVNTAHAFMGEWMLAEIGLAARQKYNTMVGLYVHEIERSNWNTGEVRYVSEYKRLKYRDQCLKELGIDKKAICRAQWTNPTHRYRCENGLGLYGTKWEWDPRVQHCMAQKRRDFELNTPTVYTACLAREGMDKSGHLGKESVRQAYEYGSAAAKKEMDRDAAIERKCIAESGNPRQSWSSGPKEWKSSGTDWSAWDKYLTNDKKVQRYIKWRRDEQMRKQQQEASRSSGKIKATPGSAALRVSTTAIQLSSLFYPNAPASLARAYEEGTKTVQKPKSYGAAAVPKKVTSTAATAPRTKLGGNKVLWVIGTLALGAGVYYATRKKR